MLEGQPDGESPLLSGSTKNQPSRPARPQPVAVMISVRPFPPLRATELIAWFSSVLSKKDFRICSPEGDTHTIEAGGSGRAIDNRSKTSSLPGYLPPRLRYGLDTPGPVSTMTISGPPEYPGRGRMMARIHPPRIKPR